MLTQDEVGIYHRITQQSQWDTVLFTCCPFKGSVFKPMQILVLEEIVDSCALGDSRRVTSCKALNEVL
jgi:hypothetical protein